MRRSLLVTYLWDNRFPDSAIQIYYYRLYRF